MGFDLSGKGGYFQWNNFTWNRLLELAEEHGWEPCGTGAPRGMLKQDWRGSYYSNDGQLFYARDAKRLAAALDRFLEATSATKTAKRQKRTDAADPYFLSREGRKTLADFIAYCRQGSFRLH